MALCGAVQEHRSEAEQPQSEPVSTADPVIVGTRLTIDGRQFEVDSVDDHTQNVSLRDVTFEGGTGFPIFRKESSTMSALTWSSRTWCGKPLHRRRTSRLRYSPR